MVAHRAYYQDLRKCPSDRTKLLYFAAAVPTVGFVYGTADLNPLETALRRSDIAPQTSKR
jgi:hypothetical protein